MAQQNFYTYFQQIRKVPKGEALPAGKKFDIVIKSCDDNESIAVPEGALVTAAYWGNPKNFRQGKDVTKKVIGFVRENKYNTVHGNTEWFGDPWYGSRKCLFIRFAIPKKEAPKPKPVPKPVPVAKPVVVTKPVVVQAKKPVVVAQATYPVVQPTAPRPVTPAVQATYPSQPQYPRPVAQQYPRPAVQQQYPRPVVQPQYPRPAVQPQYPRPVVQQQYPRPVVQQQYPRPVVQQQYPRPVVQQQYPRPVVQQQYPRPAVQPQVVHIHHHGPSPVDRNMDGIPDNLQYPRPQVAVVPQAAVYGRQLYGRAMQPMPTVLCLGRRYTLQQLNMEINQLQVRRQRQGRLYPQGRQRLMALQQARNTLVRY